MKQKKLQQEFVTVAYCNSKELSLMSDCSLLLIVFRSESTGFSLLVKQAKLKPK